MDETPDHSQYEYSVSKDDLTALEKEVYTPFEHTTHENSEQLPNYSNLLHISSPEFNAQQVELWALKNFSSRSSIRSLRVQVLKKMPTKDAAPISSFLSYGKNWNIIKIHPPQIP